LRQGVFLVKPSLRELADWAGCALNGEAAWARTAMQLVRESCASLVALSLGEQGALLASADGVWHADALKVPVASSTGAGDSFLAAMVFALARGQEPVGALRHGVAAGSAALLHTGTRLCDPGDVQRLVAQVQVRALN
jgi:6-phosphofructokinase 2